MDEQKNLIFAAGLSLLVVVVWFFLFPPQEPPAPQQQAAVEQGAAPSTGAAPQMQAADAAAPVTRADALARSSRVEISTPRLSGSIALKGGRIDDLHLLDYKTSLDEDADTVTLLSPIGAQHPFYAVYGWLPTAETPVKTPGPNTEWSLASGGTLGVDAPVTLEWDNGEGQVFQRQVSVDENYMFTIRQTVQNNAEAAITLAPYGYVARRGDPDTVNFYILHEGAVGKFDGTLHEFDYDDMQDFDGVGGPGERQQAVAANESGWLGFTDKYWMATLVPDPGQRFDGVFKYAQLGQSHEYRTEMRMPPVQVAAGASATSSTHLFAGAKELPTVDAYADSIAPGFDDSIDWGWFFFLTKPIAHVLVWLNGLIGNMGVSIIVLTFLIKAALFPLAYKSYVSMSKMKKLQPEMEKIKERCGDDKVKLQQEMMALYKKEKANPAAGCLPILPQIPIFFSLYKVLFVTIEMRHAPFFGWIQDLSAPDPSSILNLFGLLPFDAPDPSSFLAIFSLGVFPILLGISMWAQQKLNPAPTDATQATIMAWMPWVFMFMLGQFASGLVIYWVANNTITFLQQYLIMRSQGVEVDFFGNVKKSFKRKPKADAKG
ncbi:membrane protein insertase YidC [Rhodovulum sp. DZ06]|uniref:membrane protein insertase YidC n=1 Tax=Rhodovulum sp. DZ06 TaxID=3425126 RepID=UPI003D330817